MKNYIGRSINKNEAYFGTWVMWVVCFFLFFCTYSNLSAQIDYFKGVPPEITALPPAPWSPGQKVSFQIVVKNFDYEQVGTEYFHGLGIIAGSCWEEIIYGPPPAKADVDRPGQWILVKKNPPISRCGTFGIPGYYFDGSVTYDKVKKEEITILPDNIVENNFGEYKKSGEWVFTWDAIVKSEIPAVCDLTMKVYCFADGETGSWINKPKGCEFGIMEPIETGYTTTAEVQFKIDPSVCLNTITNIKATSSKLPSEIEEWNWGGGKVIKKNNDGSYDVLWQTAGLKKVVRSLINNQDQTKRFLAQSIIVYPQYSSQFSVDKYTACKDEFVTISYPGEAPDSSIFEWSFSDADSVQGSGRGPYILSWRDKGIKTVSLKIITGKCESKNFEQSIQINTIPPVLLYSSDTVICVGETITFKDNSPIQTADRIEWFFEGGNPSRAFGAGPHQIQFTGEGDYNVQLTTATGNCVNNDTTKIRVNSIPKVDVGDKIAICYGGCATLTPVITNVPSGICQFRWEPTFWLDDSTSLTPKACPNSTTTYSLYVSCGGCPEVLGKVTVVVNSAPTVTLPEKSFKICSGGSGKKLIAKTNLQGTGHKFLWLPPTGLDDPNSPTPIARPDETTVYKCIVADSNGCSSNPDSLIVVVYPQLEVDAGPDGVRCGNDLDYKITPNVTGGSGSYTYKWVPSDGLTCDDCLEPMANPANTTVYTLIVTDDETGCSTDVWTEKQTVMVKTLERPIANAGPDRTICEGYSVQIGDIPRNGQTNQYSFKWLPATNLTSDTIQSPMASPRVTTTYSVYVTNNGCTSLASTVKVTVKPSPAPRVVEGLIDICPGNTVTLQAIPPNISGTIEYYWKPIDFLDDPKSSKPKATPPVTTTYTLFTIVNGCQSKDSTEVTVSVAEKPKVDLGGKVLVYCLGSSNRTVEAKIEGNKNLYTYEWTPNEAVENPDSLTTELRINQSTRLKLLITEKSTMCVFVDSVDIIVPRPFYPEIKDKVISICSLDTLNLEAIVKGGITGTQYQYKWMAVDGYFTNPNDKISGYYYPHDLGGKPKQDRITLTVSDGDCQRRDEFIIEIIPQPHIQSKGIPDRVCVGDSVNFFPIFKDAYNITVYFGDGDTIYKEYSFGIKHAYQKPGIYDVTMKVGGDFSICKTQNAILNTTIEVLPKPKADFSSIPLKGDTLKLPYNNKVYFTNHSPESDSGSYIWDFGDGSTSKEFSPYHTYADSGKFTVKLINYNDAGCADTMAVDYIVVGRFVKTPIPNVFTPNGDGVNDVFFIQYKGSESVSMYIQDRFGVVVYDGPNGWNGALNNLDSECTEGTYFYVIKIGDKLISGSVTLIR